MVGEWEAVAHHSWFDGYRHVLFANKESGRYVLSFAGTDPWSIPDWLTSIVQGTGGDASQYKRAIGFARHVTEVHGTANVHFVGHSLGGGLDFAASIATGADATTFNPAGVHPNTVQEYGENWEKRASLIEVYRVHGEILTSAQDNTPLIRRIMPDAAGNVTTLVSSGGGGPITLHTMPAVQRALKRAHQIAPLIESPRPSLLESLRWEWNRTIHQLGDWRNWVDLLGPR